MSNDIKNKLRRFTKLVKMTISDRCKLILFGSFAKGKQKVWSDIDVAVVVPKIKDCFRKEVELRIKSLSIDDRINPIIFTQKELEENTPISVEIRSSGITL